jgi:hypothetical protein
LDVLFEDHHYGKIVERQIKNDLLITAPEYMNVMLPSRSCVLGDKLTAFAPHTTGILLNQNKNMEIIKQFYDVSSLLDEFQNFEAVRKTYFSVVTSEIGYRGIDVTAEDCLKDTYEAALCIASRGKLFSEDYPTYVKAIQDLRGHIYAENYSPEIAVGGAAKIIYMVSCLMNHHPYEKVENYAEYAEKKIVHKELQILKYLKKANPLGYAYIIKADEIMG